LYIELIKEEMIELHEAIDCNDRVEQLDALLDILVVSIGAIHSLGVDSEGAWNEVVRSNMSKIDKESGKVLKRDDGKVLKPASFSPPNLVPFVK
jgi:predicted HAD superfamily Cof-like phosphohydrolase